MKKILFCLAAALLVLALAPAVNAGDPVRLSDMLFTDTPGPKAAIAPADDNSLPDATRRVYAQRSAYVKLFGNFGLDIASRSRYLEDRLTGVPEEATIYNPNVMVGLLFFDKQDVKALLKLETPQNYIDDFGNDIPRLFAIREVYVELASLFPDVFGEEALKLKIGVQDVMWKLRDNVDYGSFFMDVSNSGDPFWPGMIPGGALATRADWGVWDTTSRVTNPGYFEFSDPGLASSKEFGGCRFTYDQVKKTGVKLDLLFGVTRETRQLNEDKSLEAAVFSYKFPKDQGKILTYLTMFSNNPSSRVWSLGAGFHMYADNSVEVFTEMVGQAGRFLEDYTDTGDQPNNLGALGRDIEQLAFGGYWGFRYTNYALMGLYIEASYWYLSGDDDQTNARQQNFLSYENVDDTMIIEDDNYGLDVDTNYQACKVRTGWVVSQKRKMYIDFLYGYFQRSRDDAIGDRIGQEVDVKFKWNYTESCSFMLGGAEAWGFQYIPGYDHTKMVMLLFNVKLDF